MNVEVIETVHRFAPLGVEFWDVLSDAPITDGLVVTARPVDASGPVRRSTPTPAGVHGFSGLPGLRDVEFPRSGAAPPPLPVERDFDVLVEDRQHRFVTTLIRLTAPRRGLVTASDALDGGAPSVSETPSPLFLFSAPTRRPPSTAVRLRAQLVDRTTERPAAYAVVKATVAGMRWFGIADGSGAVLITFPAPAFAGGLAGSLGESVPAGAHGVPTDLQTWTVALEVRSQPATLEYRDDMAVPRLHSVFGQPAAGVWADATDSGPSTQLAVELAYGRELTVVTAGADRSELLIDQSP